MKKVIIAGGRDFNDYQTLCETMRTLFSEPVIIVSGCAAGADALGERYAQEHELMVEKHPADWTNLNAEPCRIQYNSRGAYNGLAGYNRNREMLQSVLENPDTGCLVAFWDGKSAGTRNMITIAKQAGLPVHILEY